MFITRSSQGSNCKDGDMDWTSKSSVPIISMQKKYSVLGPNIVVHQDVSLDGPDASQPTLVKVRA